ncbi:nyctalopin isoform X1 [Mixophyes fleayi]|uniref:nyctalopin isoform X1 n=1 Tax=Mixophyes fleayi TaxID=3061075 RepID=UPI003F4D8F0C
MVVVMFANILNEIGKSRNILNEGAELLPSKEPTRVLYMNAVTPSEGSLNKWLPNFSFLGTNKLNVHDAVLFIQPLYAIWACFRSCPSSCACTQERNCSVLCDRIGLTEIPNEFPCEASFINLDKNNIKFLSELAFGTLPSLKCLSLSHNNISFITPGAFKGLPNLIELKMAHNEYIRYLHTRTFSVLKKLQTLDLADCNLFNIPDRIFVELLLLHELIFFQNNFRRIPGAIRGMRNLTHVYLESNRIEAVAYNSLQDIPNLKYLNLQDNKINVIHDKSFQDCQKLEYLFLNDNLLNELPENSFKGLMRLKMLNLGGNFIHNVSGVWFQDLVELEVLYLDRNKVSYIEEGAFENLTSLVSLHLNSNNLATLSFEVFKPVYFIGRLFLFKNPWECDCRIEWLRDWMESYKLVRDIPCSSPASLAGIDLRDVFFKKSPEGVCVDPTEQNVTLSIPLPTERLQSTMESKLSSLISRLLMPRGNHEDLGNLTESFDNSTFSDGKSSKTFAYSSTHNVVYILFFNCFTMVMF